MRKLFADTSHDTLAYYGSSICRISQFLGSHPLIKTEHDKTWNLIEAAANQTNLATRILWWLICNVMSYQVEERYYGNSEKEDEGSHRIAAG